MSQEWRLECHEAGQVTSGTEAQQQEQVLPVQADCQGPDVREGFAPAEGLRGDLAS